MRSRRSDRGPLTVVLAGLALVALLLVLDVVNAVHTDEHRGCHVTKTDRTSNDGKSDQRVYTDDCGTFQVRDSLLSWTWHSGDTYGSIQVGHTYDFKTRGYRVPFFSRFPNIVGVTEVSS